MSGLSQLSRWLLLGEWRAQPLRALLAIAAIAVGVAMGFAIHLINAAAFNEFTAAIKSLSGAADIQISGRERLFDETIYPVLASDAQVAVAAPVLEINAALVKLPGTLRIIGIDALRAPYIAPDLLGVPASGQGSDLLGDDTLFLSAAAQANLQLATGSTLLVRSGTNELPLRVAGPVQRARAGQRFGVMDIGALQWRFNQLGKLSRIDLKLRDGVDRAAFQTRLTAQLERDFPGRFRIQQPNDSDQQSRNSNLSRAYRVNLTVLALVALFTGAFLVFSTQALSVMRRRSQFALLRVLGLERRQLLRQVLVEGASLGVIGSLLGVAGGYGLAALVLRLFGGDLGAGYFAGATPQLVFTPVAAAVFFALGLGVALLGCLTPAIEASRARPAVALKAGNDEAVLSRLARIWPALVCLLFAGILVLLPPVAGLPIFAYLAIALLLMAGIGLMPRLAALSFSWLSRPLARRALPPPVLTLTLNRLSNAPGQAAIALGGVLASFSLMVAMGIMVASFRDSVDDWMRHILPADLYVRSASGASSGDLGPEQQTLLLRAASPHAVQFLHSRPLSLALDRPDVMLIARDIDAQDPGRLLDLVGSSQSVPPGLRGVWVSEAMLDLYGVKLGQTLMLPLGGRDVAFHVAGVWRDYANQTGAVVVTLADYRALTGSLVVSDAAIYSGSEAATNDLEQKLRALPFASALQMVRPGEIRAASLRIFDRSFAVTYLLEAIAIVIGLAGVAATFSAQTLARAREFGMLRHVGVTRGQVLAMLACEGGLLSTLGVVCGFGLGLVISLVLVFVVNPQSFHWTMQLHLPWPLLISVGAVLVAASLITALVAGRSALSGGPIRAVREDW